MSYTLACTCDLTASSAGATIHAQLYDSAGNTSGAAITSGVVELLTGIFQLVVTVPDGFVGSLIFYEDGNTDNRAAVSINPQETENADVKTSTRSSHSASDVVTALMAHALESGKSVQVALLDIWSVIVGDAAGDSASTPTSITYDSPDGTVQITHTLTTTTRAVS